MLAETTQALGFFGAVLFEIFMGLAVVIIAQVLYMCFSDSTSILRPAIGGFVVDIVMIIGSNKQLSLDYSLAEHIVLVTVNLAAYLLMTSACYLHIRSIDRDY